MTASVQFQDGFESGDWNLWNHAGVVSPLSAILQSGAVGSGYYFAAYLDDGDFLRHAITPESGKVCQQFWLRPEQFVSDHWVCAWLNGSTVLAHIRIDSSTHKLVMYYGDTNPFDTPTEVEAYALTAGRWCKVYVEMTFNTGANTITSLVYVDGIQVLTSTDAGNCTQVPDTFQLGGTKVKNLYDNVIIGSKSLDTRAVHKVFRRLSYLAGSSAEWTCIHPNWYAVTEVPLNTSRWVETNAADKRDLYATEELYSGHSYNPAFLQVQVQMEKFGTPVPTEVNLCYKLGGTTYDAADQVPSGSCALTSIWEVTDTVTPYLDDLEIGIRSRT